jgi:hypothetical protein
VYERETREEEVREALQFVVARVRSSPTPLAATPVRQREQEILLQASAALSRLKAPADR